MYKPVDKYGLLFPCHWLVGLLLNPKIDRVDLISLYFNYFGVTGDITVIWLSDGEITEMKLVQGFESVYYNEISDVDVLEIKLDKSCAINTIITLADKTN